MNHTQTTLKTWLRWSMATFLLLVLIHLALPTLFLLFQVPSFTVDYPVSILRWQNDETGTGIRFNLLFLLVIAVGIGLILTFTKTRRKHML